MSDKVRQIPFGQLMTWALGEYEQQGTIFGISKFYSHDLSANHNYSIFGGKIELPIGPAAGPHTQLAQNLISGYVSGARFFELKTVQMLDGEDLPVSKPCIDAYDEGYNVEWSTELYVNQALDEYIKGWLACKLISRELGLGSDDGFVFNMSAGYDLEGIQSVKVDSFIDGLKNAEDTGHWKTCIQWAYDNIPRFKYADKHMLDNIKPHISNSITLSTLHGCPPDEIERIAVYLLKEKGLHTYIKCNPTLAGYDYARETLDKLGYDYVNFDDRHFKNDLQFEDAVPMLGRLQELADSLGLEFGVKLTNTFPVKSGDGSAFLPGEEMYMSGRALAPLSLKAAYMLSEAFDGKLKVSYSGGADARNIADILETGVFPVTLATALLKPGGYARLHQIACGIAGQNVSSRSRDRNDAAEINIRKLKALADGVFDNAIYKKPADAKRRRSRINTPLPLTDCKTAPCSNLCPFGQDVPAYLRLVSEGKHLEALRVITERNPLPNITGTICPHNCMSGCTRRFYEQSVDIRGVKLEAAKKAFRQLLKEAKDSKKAKYNDIDAAIAGAGPAGLSAAYFLERSGCRVCIYEKRNSFGGIVRHAIPDFRIGLKEINNDIDFVMAHRSGDSYGITVKDLSDLKKDFDYVIVATGAWEPVPLTLSEGTAVNALDFLVEYKSNPAGTSLGEKVIVAGGGNTAIDTARAAKRVSGVNKVTLVYRRTRQYMPADPEELELALSEGIELIELASPVSLAGGVLKCGKMSPGGPDDSGRRSFVPVGEFFEISCDTLISAIGTRADNELIKGEKAYFAGSGNDYCGEKIFVIGDAAGGPGTVAEAIADALECARLITGRNFDKYTQENINPDCEAVLCKRGVLRNDIDKSGGPDLCLECAAVCSLCVEVCPNRANLVVQTDGKPQIVHIDFMCNECGNCAVFCPYEGAPYLEKLTYFIYGQDFDDSENPGFTALEDGTIRVRLGGEVSDHRDGKSLPEEIWQLIESCLKTLTEYCK